LAGVIGRVTPRIIDGSQRAPLTPLLTDSSKTTRLSFASEDNAEMGRGAEKQQKSKGKALQQQKSVHAAKLSLAHFSDDELTRWAKLYGVDASMSREELLVEMVRCVVLSVAVGVLSSIAVADALSCLLFSFR
jgi:hypothetical protein